MAQDQQKNLSKWKSVAEANGVLELLNAFLNFGEATGGIIKANESKSIAIHYKEKNSHNIGRWCFSCHPKKSTSDNGLYIHVSYTNVLKVLNNALVNEIVSQFPFADKAGQNGRNDYQPLYIKNKGDLKTLFEKLTQTTLPYPL